MAPTANTGAMVELKCLKGMARPLRRRADGAASLRRQAAEGQQVVQKRSSGGMAELTVVPTICNAVESAADPAKVAHVLEVVAAIKTANSDSGQPLRALSELRRFLSVEALPPVQVVVDAGGIAPLVACLGNSSAAVQLEAAWALTNAASGTSAQTMVLIEAGVIQSIFGVLASPNITDRADLCDQCLCVLGNIAGDTDVSFRDALFHEDVIAHLGRLYDRLPTCTWDWYGRIQVLRNLTLLLGSLCRGRPAPQLERVDAIFDFFVNVLRGTDDPQMLCEALWGMCFLLEGAQNNEEGVVRAVRMLSACGFTFEQNQPASEPHPLLVKIVQYIQRTDMLVPSLRLLCTLVSMPAVNVTEHVIAAGVLTAFKRVLLDTRATPQMRGDAAWALSNISAGTQAQAQQLMDANGTWEAICKMLEKGPVHRVKHECAWAITNIVKRGSPMISQLDNRRVLLLVIGALKGVSDSALQRALLDAGEALLKHGDEQAMTKGLLKNSLLAPAEEAGFLEELHSLQHADKEGVYWKAVHILSTWFEDAADRENEPPKMQPPTMEGTPKRTPNKERCAVAPSAISGGSPIRPAAYKFGA